MTDTPAALYLKDVPEQFQKLKDLADRALAQVRDDDLFTVLDAESNSLAVLMQHVGGNLRSRFTAFLTSDGEKPDRNREAELSVAPRTTRLDLEARWETGWGALFVALAELAEEDLTRTVAIRAEPHTVVRAIDRSLTHVAYHVGQIVLLARHSVGGAWQTLSIPRGGSQALNERMFGR